MTTLADVVGGVIGQINNGQSQGDAVSLQIAEIYKQNPMLASLGVPGFKIDEATIEVRYAFVETGSTAPRAIAPETRTRTLDDTLDVVDSVVERTLTEHALDATRAGWTEARDEIRRRIDSLMPSTGELDTASTAASAAMAVRAGLSESIMQRENAATARRLMRDHLPTVEEDLRSRLADVLGAAVASSPAAGTGGMDVIVDTAQLQKFPANTINLLRIVLREEGIDVRSEEAEDGDGLREART